MGQTLQLWTKRSEALTVQLFSAVIDASRVRDGTILLEILALTGGATALITAEQTLDPSDPGSWSSLASVLGITLGNSSGSLGGSVAGTTVAFSSFIRFRADVVLSLGDTIVWSASVSLRE